MAYISIIKPTLHFTISTSFYMLVVTFCGQFSCSASTPIFLTCGYYQVVFLSDFCSYPVVPESSYSLFLTIIQMYAHTCRIRITPRPLYQNRTFSEHLNMMKSPEKDLSVENRHLDNKKIEGLACIPEHKH